MAIAAVLATGGGAAPLLFAIGAGMVGGALGAGASNIASQVVANGGFKNFDKKSLWRDMIIGGIAGGLTAGISYGLTPKGCPTPKPYKPGGVHNSDLL